MIEEIHRFLLVAANGNLTRTAEKIFITQSALSQSIHRLEKALGVKLFAQKGKTLQLTSDGTAVVEIGTRIIDLWEKAKNTQLRRSIKPHYTIGVFDNAALRLGKYFQEQRQKELFDWEFTIQPSSKLLSQLQLGILDMAICVVDKKNKTSDNLILVQTFTEKLLPVSAKNYKLPIEQIPFILYNTGSHTRHQINELFTRHGITPTVFAESTSVTFMKELATLGSGVALIPENLIKPELKQKTLKKQNLPLSWEREYGIYIHKQGTLTADHQIVKEIIKNLTS